jgi:cell division inhibitor SepF
MAGAMRKMWTYLGLVEDDERYDDELVDEAEEPATVRRYAPSDSAAGGRGGATSLRRYDSTRSAGSVATTVRRVPTTAVATEAPPESYRITTLRPRSYSDALPIGENLREGTTVIMDLTDVVHDEAKRLVDFAAGLTFGLRGSIERVTREVFLLSPADVEVTAEDKARIAKGGFFNQS